MQTLYLGKAAQNKLFINYLFILDRHMILSIALRYWSNITSVENADGTLLKAIKYERAF